MLLNKIEDTLTLTARFPKASTEANKVVNLFFPTVCAGCGNLGPMICKNCAEQFPWVNEPICQRCGHVLIHPANVCARCLSPSFHLHQVRAPLIYRDPIKSIIHKMKYSGYFALAKPLAQFMGAKWPEWDIEPDLIMPVPLHPRRKKRRGFNQSALLAIQLGQQLNLAISINGLKRIKNTLPQVGLSPEKRQENVHGAFVAASEVASGKQILLIDDVFTTGATMLAAAEELYSKGAKSVSAYCLARTV